MIEWAAIGAKSRASEGIDDFLHLYRSLPEEQTQMRGNMIAHVSKLLTGIDSLRRVRISTLRNENETFSQLNSITYIGVFLRLVTYSHLP